MQTNSTTPARPGFVQTWLVAVRPWALPASVMPVLFGTTLGVTVGGAEFKPLLFVAAVFAMMLLHSGANVLSDISDFRKGLDREVTPVSGAVVRGWIGTLQALAAAALLLGLGCGLGLVIVWFVGLEILVLGIIGTAIGVAYTVGPFPLKYNGLGDLAVFLNFGIFGVLGAWTVQTGHLSWVPVLWAVPLSLLVPAILHANNWRDMHTDTACGMRSIAARLGDRFSLHYYALLIFGPFAFMALLVAGGLLGVLDPRPPVSLLLVLITLPQAAGVWRRACRRHADGAKQEFIALDGATARLNLAFGIAAACGLIIAMHIG